MKTTQTKKSHRILVWTGIFLLMGILTQGRLFSEAQAKSPRFSISISAGVFYPLQESFRKLYGSMEWPGSFQINYKLSREVFLFSGFRYLSSHGETMIVGQEYMPENHPIKLSVYSAKLGIFFASVQRRFFIFLGGGASYNFYKERWEETPISFEDKRFGFVAQGGAEYSLSRKFSLVGRIEYSSIQTKSGSKLESEIDLGGIEFSLGLSFKF